MRKFFLAIVLACAVGCRTNSVSITAAYPFEGRYDNSNTIQIDGRQIEFSKKDSVWILSNGTLYNLLSNADGSKKKFSLNNRAVGTIEIPAERQLEDLLEDEDYIWETWTVSTNAVEAL